MTPKARNIAIAEACGWTSINATGIVPVGFNPKLPGPAVSQVDAVPNYCGDLNAMHEAEKFLVGLQVRDYCGTLHDMSHGFSLFATAAHRAEAFLRTIGKWKD